jgi:hypothetical protein
MDEIHEAFDLALERVRRNAESTRSYRRQAAALDAPLVDTSLIDTGLVLQVHWPAAHVDQAIESAYRARRAGGWAGRSA